MNLSEQRCKNCRFFFKKGCRRHAPTVVVIPTTAPPASALLGMKGPVLTGIAQGLWAGIGDDEWCGEWQEKEGPP